MKNFAIIIISFAIGLFLYSGIKRELAKRQKHQEIYTRALQAKKFFIKYKKPARIEIESFSNKYQKDIAEIKQLKVPLDENSNFFMQVQLFSDDSDENAPLVMQTKFKDIKTNNLIQEDAINLD